MDRAIAPRWEQPAPMAFSRYYAAQIRINLREYEQAEALATMALALSELELQDGARLHVWPPDRAEGKAFIVT
jgi:hypothetical protein